MTDPTVAPAPGLAPETPSAPVAPNTLAEFRAQKSAPPEPVAVEPAPVAVVESEPAEPVEADGEDDAPAQEPAKGPEPAAHRWKDPDTGMTLDLRRRDHRRMKRLLEERADLARQVSQYRQPEPQERERPREVPQQAQADQHDPEPQLEQFADAPDPYMAHSRAVAKWEARQEFRQLQATQARVERQRSATAAIGRAQQEYDSGLPQARARYADFDDAHAEVLAELGRVPMPARAPLVHRLLTSPLRHDLTHYLGSHPDDLAAVASARSAYEQGMVLGAIETRVRALVNQRTPASTSTTPPPSAPMTPVGGTASPVAIPDGSKMSLAQFRANKKRLGMTA